MLNGGVQARVFLSSTTVGLRTVRDVARQAIEAAGCDPIVMEEFGAVPDYPDSVCQDRIDKSDVYVGLIGWRYGSLPPGSKQSYTEREYRYARLRGLPCLIFLLSEDLCREELLPPAESAEARSRQEQFRMAVRQGTTTVTVSDPGQLETKVTCSLRDCLRSEPWGVTGIFGRRKFLRDIHHEIVDERWNLCLVGLAGIGKSTLVSGFRKWAREPALGRDGLRVWSQDLPEPARRAEAGIAGLALNDLADLARSALGDAARDVTSIPQLTDRLCGRLGDGVQTIVVLDNVWPTHVDALRNLYERLSSIDQVSFLLTSRRANVPGLLASGLPRKISPRQVRQLEDDAGVHLLTWEVAKAIGAARSSARPDLHQLTHVFRPLASFADGHPQVLQMLAGLVVRGGDTIQHLQSCAEDIEVELHEVWEKLQNSLGPGEILHANQKLDEIRKTLLGRWLDPEPEPDGLSGPARDLLAICALLPPLPASYSSAMLQLHWQAALDASIAAWPKGREQAPVLYRQDGSDSRPRDRAFRLQLNGLCQTQLLRPEERPAGRESRCQSAKARKPETHYALHAIVAGFFHDHLLEPGQRTELHAAAEQALSEELEGGPLSNLSGMFAIEGSVWQEKMSLWLYHLAHLQPAEGRARMTRLYLDAFWWWGYYEKFPFCDLLIQNWDRVVVRGEAVDDHVAFVHHLRTLHEKYPRGWEKAGSAMKLVEDALRGLAGLIDVAVDAPPATYDDDEGRLHMQGLLHLFLAHCAFYRSTDRPIPEKDFTAALKHYEAALASFVRRREHFGSYADEWNEAWTLYELADLHASAGKLGDAEELCDKAEALERDRVERAQVRHEEDPDLEEDFVLEEVLGDIARVRADVAQSRGDLAAEARERARAVFHAYAFQIRPPQATPCENDPDRYEGGPDAYTGAFYGEMTERAIRRVLELYDQGKKREAQSMAEQLAASWQRQDRPEVVKVLDTLGISAAAVLQPAALRRALFPPVFNEQADNLDKYVQRGLELAAIAEKSAGW